MSVLQTKSEDNDLALPLLQITQQCIDMFTQHNGFHIAFRCHHIIICHEIA